MFLTQRFLFVKRKCKNHLYYIGIYYLSLSLHALNLGLVEGRDVRVKYIFLVKISKEHMGRFTKDTNNVMHISTKPSTIFLPLICTRYQRDRL